MDFFNSIEFYIIALFVAFALVGLIFGTSSRGPARTQIVAFDLSDVDGAAQPVVTLTAQPDGRMRVERPAMEINQGDTVNLVATLIDDKLKLVEKRGVSARGTEPYVVSATALLKIPQNRRLSVRYESEITGQWATASFTNADERTKTVELRY